jgi:predicted glutamine amidotransferase
MQQARLSNNEGWGLNYYANQSLLTGQGLIYAPGVTSNSNRYASYLSAYSDNNYLTALTSIKNSSAKIFLGHIQESSIASTDNTPFVYVSQDNVHAYSFVHCGDIPAGSVNAMRQFVNNNNISGLEIIDSNLNQLALSTDGSSVYYAYLLMYIKLNDWDILRGLSAAAQTLLNNADYSFVLTDSYDIYTYRKTNRTDIDKLFTCSVQQSITVNGVKKTYDVSFLMSDMTGLTFDNLDMNALVKEIQNDQLVCFSKIGKTVTINNFSTPSSKEHVKITSPQSVPNTKVWNWESFPVMMGTADDAKMTITQPLPNYSGNGFDTFAYGKNELELSIIKMGGSYFYPQTFNISPKEGLKLGTGVQDTVLIKGSLCDNNPVTSIELLPSRSKWVGYWLLNSQSLKDALGSDFNKVKTVESENWIYDCNDKKADSNHDLLDNSQQSLEFGKMYIITLKENETPIMNFHWVNSRKPNFVRVK